MTVYERLKQIDEAIFMIHMIDHWTSRDREELAQLQQARKTLMKEIERVEENA